MIFDLRLVRSFYSGMWISNLAFFVSNLVSLVLCTLATISISFVCIIEFIISIHTSSYPAFLILPPDLSTPPIFHSLSLFLSLSLYSSLSPTLLPLHPLSLSIFSLLFVFLFSSFSLTTLYPTPSKFIPLSHSQYLLYPGSSCYQYPAHDFNVFRCSCLGDCCVHNNRHHLHCPCCHYPRDGKTEATKAILLI